MNDEWIVGREDILEYCKAKFDFHSWQSVRYWKKKYKFPIRYLPNRKPFFIVRELVAWSVEFDNIRRTG